jgi:2'-5' RNA ligase
MLTPDLPQYQLFPAPHDFGPAGDTSTLFHRSDAAPGDAIFFALQPPPHVAIRISRLAWHLRDKHGLRGLPQRPRCFHVSLLHVGYHGWLPPEVLKMIDDAASTITLRPFHISFDWVESFRHPDKRPLVLRGDDGLTGVTWLRDALVAAMEAIGFTGAQTVFTPHLTLLRDENKIREEPVEDISWPVREFVLVRSLYGEGQHIPLGRWKLRG